MMRISAVLLAVILCLSLCACGNKEPQKSQSIKDVEGVISAIGDVTLDSEEAITKAERMYNFLTDSEKTLVENKGMLVEARYAYDKLYAFITKRNF